jgi:hypothetical protein
MDTAGASKARRIYIVVLAYQKWNNRPMRDNNKVGFFSSGQLRLYRYCESRLGLAGRLTPHDSAVEFHEYSCIQALMFTRGHNRKNGSINLTQPIHSRQWDAKLTSHDLGGSQRLWLRTSHKPTRNKPA